MRTFIAALVAVLVLALTTSPPTRAADLRLPDDMEGCVTREGRSALASELLQSGQAELRVRATAFQLDEISYSKVAIDVACWFFYYGNDPSEIELARKLYPFLSKLDCDANWNEHCTGAELLEVPKDWQICRVLYTVATRRGDTRLNFEPAQWFNTGVHDAPRFRAYQLTMRADGSGAILDQEGARISLRDINIDAVSAALNEAERRARGCAIPEKPPLKPVVESVTPHAPGPSGYCGLVYVSDNGTHGIMRATRYTSVMVNNTRKGKLVGSQPFTLNINDTLTLLLNRDGQNHDGYYC